MHLMISGSLPLPLRVVTFGPKGIPEVTRNITTTLFYFLTLQNDVQNPTVLRLFGIPGGPRPWELGQDVIMFFKNECLAFSRKDAFDSGRSGLRVIQLKSMAVKNQ